jgi:2-polyprenyl-3-methyl-5-hydroxy-6-metoxy-1,4-benzoquinol methylase
MSDKNKYLLYGDRKTFSEVKEFIDDYRSNLRENNDNRYNRTLEFIDEEQYVLDYGCGWGIFSQLLADKKSCIVDGIDQDADSIRIAQDVIGDTKSLHFSNKPIREITDEQYDYVISNQVIEHTHNPGNYLSECNRVLKKNGFLVITLPNVINLRFVADQLITSNHKLRRRIQNFKYDKTWHHIQAWDPFTFLTLLESVGFVYEDHAFMEGMALPFNRYIFKKIRIPCFSNLSYTMLFKVKKDQFIKIRHED